MANLSPPGDPQTEQELDASARVVVRRYMGWAALVGLIAIPWVDIAALSGVQMIMLVRLAAIHRRPFPTLRTGAIAGTLVASLAPQLVVDLLPFKTIPFIGTFFGFFNFPLCNGSVTWVLGRVCLWYIASRRDRNIA